MNIKLISGLELNTNLSIIRFLCILLILILFIVSNSFAQNISKNRVAKGVEYYKTFPKKLQKQIQPLLKDMILIPGGAFEMGRSLKGICTDENDSNLIVPQNSINVTISPFLLCSHEVTNQEYKEFVNYVKDSMARRILSEVDSTYFLNSKKGWLNYDKVIDWHHDSLVGKLIYRNSYYPDELDFLNENISFTYPINTSKGIVQKTTLVYPDTAAFDKLYYRFCAPMMTSYFYHPGYREYPVVGVNWDQAFAFCQWKNSLLEKEIRNHPELKQVLGKFHLPLEAEWEFAAFEPRYKNTGFYKYFEWQQNDNKDKKNIYRFNFGLITDPNNFTAKYLDDDGCEYTCRIALYAPNQFGLYDMSGNVAEWVWDDTNFDYNAENDLYQAIRFDYIDNWDCNRLTKGGSWADNIIYQHTSSKVWMHHSIQSGKNGFRIAMTVVE